MELRTPQKYSPIECDGVQFHQYWMTLLLYVYTQSFWTVKKVGHQEETHSTL